MTASQPKPEPAEPELARSENIATPVAREHSDSLHVLLEASASLLAKPDLRAVLDRILELSRQLIHADAYAVWRLDEDGSTWRVLASRGLSAAYLEMSSIPATGITELADEPIVAADVNALPLLEHRRRAYAAEGVRSLVALPLRIQGRNVGTITFYFRSPRQPQSGELQLAELLANLAASGISTAELYEEQVRLRQQAEAQRRRATFLAQASAALGSSLDFNITLQRVAELAVPEVADWCAVFVGNEKGAIERTAVAHRDPAKVKLAAEFHDQHPPSLASGSAVATVIETGEPQFFPEITEDLLRQKVDDPERLRLVRELSIKSVLVVPMASRDRVLGALILVTAESGRMLSPADLELAEALAARAAAAIDNAHLYRQVRQQLEERARTEVALIKTERLATAGRLAATIAHEINNPLEAVTNLIYLARTAPPEEAGRYLRMVEEELSRIAHITKMTLGFYRDSGAPGAVNMGELVREVLALYEVKLRAKNIRVQFEEGEPQSILGSKGELRQVLANLVANALDVLPNGGALRLSIRTDLGMVQLQVADNGSGISSENLNRIFEPFFTTKAELGTGLGLWVSRQIVEKHGGTIAVESSPAGTCFTISLPAASQLSRAS
ncbi:MAG TPA: GAF domain-containing protein [Terriglobales bacterium]|nr:GAF domain-containing protein [Terriglobales bacterium]